MKQSLSKRNYKWVILIHQIPPKPTSRRVKIWRCLQTIGAAQLKHSVYILPFTKQTHEDFQWLRQQIIAQQGNATIFMVDSIEGINEREIVEQFREIRNRDYDEIVSTTVRLKKSIEGGRKNTQISHNQLEKYKNELEYIKDKLNKTMALDFFKAPKRENSEKAITQCSELIESIKLTQKTNKLFEKVSSMNMYDKSEFQNKAWVTRKGLHIDRIASAWLIKRFIDKAANFSFIAEEKIAKNGVGFDMYSAEFSHRGDDCTFETMLKCFNLKKPVLTQIAEVVHDIDLKDGKFGRKEAEGINQIIIGLSEKLKNDKKLLDRGMEIFDALYQYYLSETKRK